MKTAVIYRNNIPVRTALRYPNAADRRKILNKIVDLILVGAISISCAAIVMFLVELA